MDNITHQLQPLALDITTLVPDPRNARQHHHDGLTVLMESLRRFGQRKPIVVQRSTMTVRAGNGTLEAARRLGWSQLAAVLVDDDDETATLYAVADNRTAELSGWDYDQLYGILQQLPDGWDAGSLGFSDLDLQALQDGESLGFDLDLSQQAPEPSGGALPGDQHHLEDVLEDEPPEVVPDAAPDSLVGQLYRLGPHRLMCGSAASSADVATLMGGATARLIWTDPPYNVGSENKGVAQNVSRAHHDLMAADWDKGFSFESCSANLLACCAPDCTVYVCTSHHLAPSIWGWMAQWAQHHSYCTWSKPNPMPSLMKRHWTWNSELICYATRGRHVFNFPQEGHALSTWHMTKQNGSSGHPTEKPVKLPAHAILHSSQPGDLVVDLFGGSGSTLMACCQTDRTAYLMELDPRWCDVIRKRWTCFAKDHALDPGDGAL